MEKKYVINYDESLVIIRGSDRSKITTFCIAALLVFCLIEPVTAQLIITKPSASITACAFPTNYVALSSNIVITETSHSAFLSTGSGQTLIFTAPANFEFLPGTGNITVDPSGNLSAASLIVTASTITITYTCGNTNKADVMTISNLQIRAINTASSGNIIRTGGTGIVSGLSTSTTLSSSLTSISTPYPVISTQPFNTSVCTNGTATMSVFASGATSYQWRRAGVNLTNVAPYNNVNTSVLTITNPALAIAGNFDVVINNGSCATTSNAAVLTVNAFPSITSPALACVGSSVQLSPTSGGTWVSNNSSIASVNNAGLVNALSAGNATFTFTNSTTNCSATTTALTVNNVPVVNAPASVCVGNTIQLSPSVGGTWTSSNLSLASVSNTGLVNGIAAGNVTFTYTNTSSTCSNTTSNVAIDALPIVSAPASVCVGSTIQLLPASAGIWVSNNPTIASINNSGLVNGLAAGNTTFTFTNTTTNCSKTTSSVMVNSVPLVSAPATVCVGSSIQLSPATGGTWTSSNSAIASVDNTGLVGGITSGTVTFTFTNTITGCNKITSAVTVNDLPVVSSPTSVCIGNTIQLSPTTGGTWSSNNPTFASVTNAGLVTGVAAGIATFTFTSTSTNCSKTTSNVTVNTVPVVSTPVPVCIGYTAQLSPSTGGIWISNNPAFASVNNNGDVLALASGTATFTFTDSATNCSATTGVFNIYPAPAVTTQPAATQSACLGATATLTIIATAGVAYQWYNGAVALTNGGSISGANTPNLTINPVTAANASSNYYCEVSGSCGATVNSDPSTLVVHQPVTITTQPILNQTFCTGNSATISVAATGDGITYQWYKGTTALVDGGSISGATTNTFTINSLALSDAANNYYCVVSGLSPCNPVSSNIAALIVNQSPTITSHPSITQTICTGDLVGFSVTANGGSLIYQWFKGTVSLSNGGNISGATSATLTINPVTAADAASDYYCILNNGCSTNATSNNATLVVNPKPVIPAQSVNECTGVVFSLLPTNSVPTAATIVPANTVYSWPAPTVTGGLSGGAAQNNQVNISGTLHNPTNTNQTATYTVTPISGTSVYCPGATFTVTVTVKPNSSVANVNSTICSGDTINIVPANGSGNIIPAGTQYSWGVPTVTGGLTGDTSGTTLASITQTLTNPTNTAQTATYNITGVSAGCTGNAFTLVITVSPKPVASVNIASQTICSSVSNSPLIVSNSVNGATTYSWTRDNTINVTGTLAATSGTIAAGNTFSISNILTNTTSIAQTVVYTITPTANGCIGTPATSTVVVSPSSVGGAVTASMPNITPVVNVATVCHSGSGTLYLSGNIGNVVRWEYSVNGGTTWTSIANTAITYNYSNITQATIFRALVQNGSSCFVANSTVTMINVIPNVKPTPVTATPPIICVGDSSILFSQSGYATSQYIATGGTFSNANPANWQVDGCGNCLSAGASNTNPGPFQLSATNGGTYSGINYTSVGKFAIVSGNFNSIMQTPAFNTFGLTSLSLNFNHAFNLLTGATATVELSLDGGATYTVILAQYTGPQTRTPYTAFPLTTIDMSQYLGQSNLKIRFKYNGTVGSSWAVDNIILPDPPLNLTTQWVDSVTGAFISNAATLTVSPTITTTYAVTSFLNGCASFGPLGTSYVTVNVNPKPTANIGPSQTICSGGTATFSVALTGFAPWTLTYSNATVSTVVNNVNTNPYVFSVNNITVNTVYSITALSDTKCTAKPSDLTGAATVTVLNGTPGLWTGLLSTDWFDCRNWEGGLPSGTINAVIPASSPRMPLIDPANSPFAAAYANIAAAQDIIIANGASLTMAGASTSALHISRDWMNSGTFTPGIGTVTFNGATSNQIQNINVGIKIWETFYNLSVNGSNGVKGISLVDGFQLTVLNDLALLNGDLRLTGEAQLVQSGLVANTSSGTGKLLRDQQGTKSSFNYNYWSSPVSADNTNYTVGSVLRDGTDVTINPFSPGTINFGDGVSFSDGALTSPIKISNRWIYKYTLISTSYFSWQAIGSTGNVKVGEGFTMKGTDGTAVATSNQNYVFVGKPNNGTINLNIALSQEYLVGNPYPSALDADLFIKDNLKDGGNATSNSFNGALYFWDHFGGHTHYLAGYVGGYATYTLIGGVVAIANDPLNINDGSTGTKVPSKYIPVGQAFFIKTTLDPSVSSNLTTAITGGPIIFRNAQRAFKPESTGNSVFFRTQNAIVSSSDDRPKIRLQFISASGLRRQILVGADLKTTPLFDIGYDAPIIDINPDDMYWQFADGKFVIQGIPDFNADRIIPLGIVITNPGASTFKLKSLENVSNLTNIYLHDSETGIYYDIKNDEVILPLVAGTYSGRFSLRFSNAALGVNNPDSNNIMNVFYTNGNHVLNIENHSADTKIKEVYLFNSLGQSIAKWTMENPATQNIQIPILNISTAAYIVKLKTSNGEINKKIIVSGR